MTGAGGGAGRRKLTLAERARSLQPASRILRPAFSLQAARSLQGAFASLKGKPATKDCRVLLSSARSNCPPLHRYPEIKTRSSSSVSLA